MSSPDHADLRPGHEPINELAENNQSRVPEIKSHQDDLIQLEDQPGSTSGAVSNQNEPVTTLKPQDDGDQRQEKIHRSMPLKEGEKTELLVGTTDDRTSTSEQDEITDKIRQISLIDMDIMPATKPTIEPSSPQHIPTPKDINPSTEASESLAPSQSEAPTLSRRPSTRDSQSPHEYWSEKEPVGRSSTSSDAEFDEKQAQPSAEPAAEDTKGEIQSIMDQFSEADEAPSTLEEVMSPRLELAQFLGGPIQHPPRKSSLEPINSTEFNLSHPQGDSKTETQPNPPVPPKDESYISSSARASISSAVKSPGSGHAPPPPAPDPEPDLPFDFHRFLEQLRHRTADPVAKFLRSFLNEFQKKQWMVHEQVKIISDFLAFITVKMAQCEVWLEVSDAEFDNAKEGMEKLVMNRLYTQTFSPAIPPPQPPPRSRGRRKDMDKLLGPGRRGQHQEDVERDEILAQKVKIYGWIKEEHLDIVPVGPSGKRFLALAQQELLKIKGYRAPRDKIICVLNCCKVIFGLLKNSKSADTSADSFIPLLIYVVLQANPDHLVSNVQYILRFRNQEKLGGEAGYYLSSLMGAIQFIENLDRTSLTISDEEFEKNVEAAVSAIAERNKMEEQRPMVPEKSKLSRPEITPRNSMEGERSLPQRSTSRRDTNRGPSQPEGNEENAAVAGLLRTIQRPLSTIGRILSDTPSEPLQPSQQRSLGAISTPQPGSSPRLSPSVYQTPLSPRNSEDGRMSGERTREAGNAKARQKHPYSAEEAAARQASAEVAEAQRIQRAEHYDVVETLAGMFPALDKEVIDDVVRLKEGRFVSLVNTIFSAKVC
ncbi:MAG: hypothetical protein M1834_008135 [Cirrosporium novae-zelandiae]|nr:MAG: hypothetical protein M1834_008135 [Cirrosporium novae-zelandiae]